MSRLVLGTAGHIDHGKTALVRSLTGQDPDRLPEEKRRGITIDLGFAHLLLPDCEYAVVDVPGHESLVRNMLAGATGIDVVLLVIAADEGVMPQTREHLAIMELLEVREAVIALTKMDLVTAEWLELVCDDVRAQLATSRYAAAPMIPVSAVTGEGLEHLRVELSAAAARCAPRSVEDLFRLPIDRVFTVRGTGTVVTGTIWSGLVREDAVLRAVPGDVPVRVRGLQRHGTPSPHAGAGERIALAVGAPRESLERGATLVDDPAWQPTGTITVELQLLADAPALKNRQRVRLHLGTAEVLARCVTYHEDPILPGARAWCQLRLEAPLVARARDRFVLRSYSPVHTIAGGAVAEPTAPKRKRLDPGTIELLEAVIRSTHPLPAIVRLAGRTGAAVSALPVLTGLPPARLQPPWPGDVCAVGDRLFPASWLDNLRDRLVAAVAEYHAARPLEPGPGRDELRRAIPEAAPYLADQLAAELVTRGQLIARGPAFSCPEFRPTLSRGHEIVAARLLGILAAAGLAAPRFAELPPELRDHPDLAAVARHLVREGRVVALAHDHLIDPAALAQAARLLAGSFAEHPRQSASMLKEVLGLTRKHLIPILEYCDRVGITRRDGDDRMAGTGLRATSGEGA